MKREGQNKGDEEDRKESKQNGSGFNSFFLITILFSISPMSISRVTLKEMERQEKREKEREKERRMCNKKGEKQEKRKKRQSEKEE